jgi:Mrp family chromosome partitioning ATPase/capsular polysaccharide biosynthesis protein
MPDIGTHEGHHPTRQRTLVEYLDVLRRRRWIALLPLVIVPVVVFVYVSRQPDVYASSSEVLLSRQSLASALSGVPNADVYTDADRFAQTQASLARVPEVASNAIAKSGVKNVTAGELLANSSVTPRGNSDLLRFVVRNGDPAAAGQLATAYAQAFTRYRLRLDTADIANARTDLERTLSALRRQGATETSLYRDVAAKAQELRTMELLQTKPKVVRTADFAALVAPTPTRDALLGIGVGLLLGLGAAFLWEALDKRVRDETEIQRALELPLLARLPAPRATEPGRIAILDDPGDSYAEAVRRLRSNVEFANLDVNAKVIMVTSAVGDEGKSVTVANLAVAFALAGRRVALVDLDLRKPTLGRMFGVGLRPGLTDVAIERIALDRALIPVNLESREPVSARHLSSSVRRSPTLVEGADRDEQSGAGSLVLLPAGFLPASPGELVGTQAVAGILATLRDEMDVVLVDSPPLLVVSDAATLSARMDAMAIVVRSGTVNRPMLKELGRELEASPARKLGFALTGADAQELYGASYGYAARESSGDERPRRQPVSIGTDVGAIESGDAESEIRYAESKRR